MTWIQIVDTIVKVGLGALISGVLALRLAHQNQKAELQKNYLVRRQGFVDIFMEEFEPLHIEIYEHAGKMQAMLRTIDAGFGQDIKADEHSVQQDQNIENSLQYRGGITLYKLQAKLLYLSLSPIAELLHQYNLTSQELLNILPDVDELIELLQEGRHDYDLEILARNAEALSSLRDKIYLLLGKADRGEPIVSDL